jgi:hypothetical protein
MVLTGNVEELVRTKKSLGRAKRTLGSSRHTGHGHRLHQPSLRPHRDQPAVPGRLDGALPLQILSVEGSLRQSQRAYALIPRDHWLEQWEKDAIIDFHHQFPLEGYRRLTFMMLARRRFDTDGDNESHTYAAEGVVLTVWNREVSLLTKPCC